MKTAADLIKGHIPMMGGRKGEVEKFETGKGDPVSFLTVLCDGGVREHPCLSLYAGKSGGKYNLHSHM